MVWTLIAAHLLGDFPLQPNWLVRRKKEWGGLVLHVLIHLMLMIILVGGIRSVIWPYLLLLSSVHLVQDYLKVTITERWPRYRTFLFFLDQLFHFMAIWGLTSYIGINLNIVVLEKPIWLIVGIAYLVATHVWYISERVMNLSNHDYFQNIEETKYSRMVVRGGLISLFWLVGYKYFPGIALITFLPYPSSEHRKRAIISDVSISLLVILFLFLTLKAG